MLKIMLNEYLQYIQEGYVFSDKTISVNLDKFENGSENKLLIIGLMGSGKTTLAEFLSKNKSKMVDGKYPSRIPKVKWRSIDSMYYRLGKKHSDEKLTKEELIELVYDDTIKLIKNNERWIIEGVDLIDIYRVKPKYRKLILSKPMIIMGLSALKAGIRAGIRNMKRPNGEGWREMYWFSKINMKELESTLKILRRDIEKLNNAKIETYRIPKI